MPEKKKSGLVALVWRPCATQLFTVWRRCLCVLFVYVSKTALDVFLEKLVGASLSNDF